MTTLIDQARRSIELLHNAAYECAQAHNHVAELEDERALIKPEAIKRIMEQGLAGSNSAAEKIVEQDPFYAEHRVKQRQAENLRWASLGCWEAAKLTAQLDVAIAGGCLPTGGAE